MSVGVPTPAAGVYLRRAVAGDGGLANVRFESLTQLASGLSARSLALGGERRQPLTSSRKSVAVRRSLADVHGRLCQSAAAHHATTALLEGLLTELDDG